MAYNYTLHYSNTYIHTLLQICFDVYPQLHKYYYLIYNYCRFLNHNLLKSLPAYIHKQSFHLLPNL